MNTILDELEKRAEIEERRVDIRERRRRERGEERGGGERGEDGDRRGELTRQSHSTHTDGENLYM
jgi:hypothetical protein